MATTTYSQDLIWTVLPFGQITESGHSYLRFSVIVSPRLMSSSSAATVLSNYPDWSSTGKSWPDTVAALESSFQLTTHIGSSTHTFPATMIGAHQPDSTRFAAMLPGTTPVTPYSYSGFENRKIRSAPVGTAVDIISNLYGEFGTKSPTAYPTYNDLVPANAFGALGFEQLFAPRDTGAGGNDPGIPGNGAARKQTLVQTLESAFANAKAIPYDLSALAASLNPAIPGAKTSLAFLEHQRFLQRNLDPTAGPVPAPTPPQFDFHQIVASVTSLPTLMRVLGLVLDFRAGPIESVPGIYGNGTAQFVINNALLHAGTNSKLPAVQCTIVKDGTFRPLPMDPSNTELANRMLKVGDPTLCRVVRVDHDSSVVKTMQFANTVTRSHRNGRKLTLTTPGRYALPALRTGGFAVARSGRAVQMAAILKRQTDALQARYFGVGAAPPTLFEDDITRGYRFDILDRTDGIWRSLMWRQGTVTVDGTDPLKVLEEDCVVPSPTTASTQPTDPGDLYLQETLARWDGWSLAVPRVGIPFQDQDLNSGDSGSQGFNITTDWHVPGSSSSGDPEPKTGNLRRLPRLRFGQAYQIRARAVDLAGNSLPVDGAPGGVKIVSPALKHLRFEPVAAPRLLFVTPPGPAGAEEVVVIRSESRTVNGTAALDNGTSVRLVVPSPTSVFMAEQYGAFDLATTGLPMNQAVSLYKDLAQRDALDVSADGKLYHPSQPHSASNPFHFPPFLPINYLPEFAGRAALVRGLPKNTNHATVARLPFDIAHHGWPKLQATRIVLGRGVKPNWKTREVTDPSDHSNVTTELDLVLGKGDMITTVVNARLTAAEVNLMAIWEWIEAWAVNHGVDPANVYKAILAGEHWMITPWRPVTFVHAVRTPLKDPKLFLLPAKSTIGQTNAVFDGRGRFTHGTVLMSRKSTARIDVDGTWQMPVDTGTNADPVTPQDFAGHAFTLEIARVGGGVNPDAHTSSAVKVPDAENFLAIHEFNDTKFRAVNYKATATSFYVEYFRQHKQLALTGNPVTALQGAAVEPGVAFEASTVKLTLAWTDTAGNHTRALVAAPPGTALNTPPPTPGDFVVIQDPNLASDPAHATHGTVQMLKFSSASAPDDATVEFSYVGPTIHTYSHPAADKTTAHFMHVPNSKRPTAPSVRYVVPIYRRSTSRGGVITHKAGALRVYLDRPWWSSGDGERLGVVCWHQKNNSPVLPPSSIAPYVTLWGFDPVHKTVISLPGQPTPSCFPLNTAHNANGSLSIDESTVAVDVAGHPVGFDATRNLWYCDIAVTGPNGKELASYTPFIRFAFARYQPISINNAHLSKVVVVDYAQLAPNRFLTMKTRDKSHRAVTVAGRAATGTAHSPSTPSLMVAIVEQRDPRIADEALAWSPAGGQRGYKNTYQLTASVSEVDYVTWSGEIALPITRGTPKLRVTFEEFERIGGGAGHGRIVFTESIPIN